MGEIRNIVRDVKSGALPKEEIPSFVAYLLRRFWILVPLGALFALVFRALFSANNEGEEFDPHSLYRNAGDGVYVPYPIKPAIFAKLPKRKAVRRSSLWKTWAAALALVLRVSALTLLMYVVFLLVR
jgi:hypothetical protein